MRNSLFFSLITGNLPRDGFAEDWLVSHGRASAFAISIADLSMSATARFDVIAANPAGLCEEVHLNLAYRWFCRLGLDGKVPDHSTFSKNRHGRFRR